MTFLFVWEVSWKIHGVSTIHRCIQPFPAALTLFVRAHKPNSFCITTLENCGCSFVAVLIESLQKSKSTFPRVKWKYCWKYVCISFFAFLLFWGSFFLSDSPSLHLFLSGSLLSFPAPPVIRWQRERESLVSGAFKGSCFLFFFLFFYEQT